MATLFATNPGQVSILADDTPASIIMAIGGRGQSLALPGRGSFSSMRAIITGVAIEEHDKFQIQTTMNDTLFAYVFGRGISDFKVAGIAFSTSACGQNDNRLATLNSAVQLANPFNNQFRNSSSATGVERIMTYFNQTRVSQSGQAYDMVLGISAASRYKVLLHSMTMEMTKPEQRLVDFSLSFKAFR